MQWMIHLNEPLSIDTDVMNMLDFAFNSLSRVTHICVSKLIIGSGNGLSPGRRRAII